MKSKANKIAGAAHIKHHTRGTSNEISLSVLDAAKAAREDEGRTMPRLGGIALFTLGRVRRPAATPTKEKGLLLSTGEFVSAESGQTKASSTPSTVPGLASEGSLSADSTSSGRGVAAEELAGRNPSSRASSVSGMSWQASKEEVARRKSTRKRRRRLAYAGVFLTITLVIAGAATALYAGFQDHQSKQEQILACIQRIEGVDEIILPFDELVMQASEKPLSQLSAQDVSAQLELLALDLADEESELAAIKQDLDQVQNGIADQNLKEVANNALISINARANMIQSGQSALKEAVRALGAYDKADQAWGLILEGDAAARAAAALASETGTENITSSMEKSNEAMALFNEARELLVAAHGAYTADLSVFVDYVDLRIEAQRLALTSDQAYLDRDKEMLAEANEAYNKADSEAVALIKEQQSDPQTLISGQYEQNAADSFDSYLADRSRAAEADAFLRDYLGSAGK